MPGESQIISLIKKRARADDQVLVGIGDDAAIIKTGGAMDLIACSDLMVEGVHFRCEWGEPRLIGHKALAVTLSDVAAMGGIAKFALINIALPHRLSSEFIAKIFQGIFDLADSCGVSIIGGDTSSSRDSLFIDTSVIGECASGRALTRRGARVGDTIYVTGTLGASTLGLQMLEQGARLDDREDNLAARRALMKHLAPEPRLKTGRAIAEMNLATAMIDISDGLSTDLCHILYESDCGAIIRANAIPIDESVRSLSAATSEIDPLRLALDGGEEYELLFTVRPESRSRVAELSSATGIPITPVGEIVSEKGLQLMRDGTLRPVKPSGYEHMI
jgi:thiamine-monophosphate kinase